MAFRELSMDCFNKVVSLAAAQRRHGGLKTTESRVASLRRCGKLLLSFPQPPASQLHGPTCPSASP